MSASTDSTNNVHGFRKSWVPVLVLVAGFALTGFATYYAARSVKFQTKQEFESAIYDAQSAVRTRLESYLALLRGGTAFFSADPSISRESFHKYVERLRLPVYYPGIQGFGFTKKILPGQLENVIAEARLSGVTNFNIWPVEPGKDTHSILYLEPLDRRNYAALGYNMFSEPTRRAAISRACDLGTAVATSPVTLVQEIEGRVQRGFLIYAPVYEGGLIPETVAERQKALLGFIYAPFRADDLFDQIIPPVLSEVLETEIFDGDSIVSERLLYKSPTANGRKHWFKGFNIRQTVPFTVAEHRWTMRFTWQGSMPGAYLVPLVFAAGAFITLALWVLAVSESRARARAEVANAQLTRSEHSLREAREGLERHARELEQRVAERTARLQETVRDLEAVLYHVAHDLRAPVRAMGSFASILKDDYSNRLDERAIGYLNRISEAARRMDRLVYDLLAYGRLSQMSIDLEPVSLEKAVSLTLSRSSDEFKKRGAQVEVSKPMPEVLASASVLSDIMLRLVDNALKFTPSHRQPKLRIWAENGASIRCYFEDNGIGIEPEYHERIFRVFERLHAGSAYPGTGIGLALARKGLERMRGKIGLESIPGQGSKFWIELEKPKSPPRD